MFYHQNTRSCYATGDICSFSTMDLEKDGDSRFANNQTYSALNQTVFNRRTKKGHAKVELSLMNFVTQNPDWKPPTESEELVQNVRDLWSKDLEKAVEQQQITASTVFGPLTSNLSLIASMSQSVGANRHRERTKTPPPSPTATSIRQSTNQQVSTMLDSNAGGFSESTAAALSASSMLKSLQQNSFIQAPTALYYNNAVPLNVQGDYKILRN